MFSAGADQQFWFQGQAITDGDDDEKEENADMEVSNMELETEAEGEKKEHSLFEFPKACPILLATPNGQRTRYSPDCVKDFVAKFESNIDPRIFKGLQSETLALHWARAKKNIALLPFLPMPMHTSPVILLLKAISSFQFAQNKKEQQDVWFPKYTHFQASIFELGQVRLACQQKVFPVDQKVLEEANEELYWQDVHLEKKVYVDLDAIYTELSEKSINEKQALARFLDTLKRFTLSFVRTQETYIWKCMLKHHGVPWKAILSPSLDNSDWSTHLNFDEYVESMLDYFTTKQMGWNKEFRLANKEYKFKDFFHLKELPTRLKVTDASEIFDGFITRATAWEYFVHLDANKILSST